MKSNKSKYIIQKYTLIGVIFGCMFPLGAILFELYRQELIFSLENLIYLHREIPILYMIDTAPIFLGGFAFISGFIRNDLEKINIELKIMANNDELTGLYNRRFGNQRIHDLIVHSEFDFFIAFLDLDKFKYINDTAGHDYGDKVLQIIGKRLVNIVSCRENVIRLGGDEFMLILDVEPEELNALMIKVTENIRRPIIIQEKTFFIKSSIGIVKYPDNGDNVNELLRKADIAMYNCKKNLTGEYCIFDEEMLRKLEVKASKFKMELE